MLERVRIDAIDRFGKKITVVLHVQDDKVQVIRDPDRHPITLESVLYFKGHLVYIKRDPILLWDPDRPTRPTDWSESTVEIPCHSCIAVTAVADRTNKTSRPAELEWNYPPCCAVEILLISTTSILHVCRTDPRPPRDRFGATSSIDSIGRIHHYDRRQQLY